MAAVPAGAAMRGLLGLLVLLACRADVLYDEGACDARARDGGAWDEWAVWGLLEATAVAVDWTQRGRERWLQQEGAAVAAASDAALDVPAYVMNLARRQDRRQHSAALLRALGVRRVVFPETIPAAELDVQAVLAQGWLTPESLRGMHDRVHLRADSAKRAYIANTIGHLSALRKGVDSGSEVFLVLEDDLLPAAPLLKVRERLQEMLGALLAAPGPAPAADMLYLEYCFEACNQTHLHRRRCWDNGAGAPASWLVQARQPVCSGAIAYTRAGAQRVLEQCVPIFDGIDGMLPALIANGSLRALAAAPPLFYQDGYWGTDAGRRRDHSAMNFTEDHASAHGSTAQHFIYLPPCSLLGDSNMSLVGSNLVHALRGQEEKEFVDEALTRRVRVPAAGPGLLTNNVQVEGPEQEKYFAERGTRALVIKGHTSHADAVGLLYSHSVYSHSSAAPASTGALSEGTDAACRRVQRASLDPEGFEVPVGAWSWTQDLVLHVPPASTCWRHADSAAALSLCPVKLVWHSHSGIDLYFQHLLLYIEGAGRRGASLSQSWPPPDRAKNGLAPPEYDAAGHRGAHDRVAPVSSSVVKPVDTLRQPPSAQGGVRETETGGESEDGRGQEEQNASVKDEFVGRRLAVYEAQDGRWYSGRVASLDPSSGAHVVEYDDGVQEIFNIAVADRRFLRLE